MLTRRESLKRALGTVASALMAVYVPSFVTVKATPNFPEEFTIEVYFSPEALEAANAKLGWSANQIEGRVFAAGLFLHVNAT